MALRDVPGLDGRRTSTRSTYRRNSFGSRTIGPFDALIAGQAKARSLILVTNNTGGFERVDGLRVQDWTLAP